MPKKMPRRLVALSASAVTAIYFVGLVSTQAAAQTVAAPSVGAPIVVVGASASATSATAAAATASTYADGTYSASGTSRFGNVTVSITISGNRIANVQITKVTTSFPVSRIASLPAQVVQNQTSNVNAVTGATYSSQAFKQAVQQALVQALAATPR